MVTVKIQDRQMVCDKLVGLRFTGIEPNLQSPDTVDLSGYHATALYYSLFKIPLEEGADIIFFPSAYPAARQIKTLAWLNQCFIVSSTMTRASSIFDISGDIIETTGKYRRWAGAVLPIGKKLFEIDFHISKMRKIKQKYGSKVSIQWYHDDDLVSLASLDPDLTVADLIDEFELTPHPDYIQRAQKAQDKQRPPQASANQ